MFIYPGAMVANLLKRKDFLWNIREDKKDNILGELQGS